MARKKKKRRGHQRREGLVHGHLERVSGTLLEKHREIVRTVVGRNAGIYALYRKDKLYYVGLATALRGRLKAHLKNRHKGKWDRFSIYLTTRDEHLRELEALAIRIAAPLGTKQKGRLAQSHDLRPEMKRAIRRQATAEASRLFEQSRATEESDRRSDASKLTLLLPHGAILRGTNRNKIFHARARYDGRVRYNGRKYSSLSTAAEAALKRPTNGWWFWKVKRGGQWTRLKAIREDGTPVYSR